MRLTPAVAAVFAALLVAPPVAHAAEGAPFEFGNVVKPDKALARTADRLLKDLAAGAKARKTVEKAFAGKVLAFTRGLDVVTPWHALDPITSDPLGELSDFMVEKAEMIDASGNSVADKTDYRPQAMAMMADILASPDPWGTLPEAKGMVCKPAAFAVDLASLTAFAESIGEQPTSLAVYDRDVTLHKKPAASAPGTVLPAYTGLFWSFKKDLPPGWDHYTAMTGESGYVKTEGGAASLSRNHLCFKKINGQWKIGAAFGYGL